MTSQAKKVIDGKITRALGVSCILAVFIVTPLTFRVYAFSGEQYTRQQQQQQQQLDTDQRLTRLETEVEDTRDKLSKLDPVATEARLTRLESALDTIKNLLIALVAGIGLMLLEAGHRLLKPKDILDLTN